MISSSLPSSASTLSACGVAVPRKQSIQSLGSPRIKRGSHRVKVTCPLKLAPDATDFSCREGMPLTPHRDPMSVSATHYSGRAMMPRNHGSRWAMSKVPASNMSIIRAKTASGD